MTKIFHVQEWLKYQIIADNPYNIHSPFLYQFWENIISPAKKDTFFYTEIKPVFESLCHNFSYLEKHDLGTGKRTGKERVSQIAKTSSVRPKYGHILRQLIKYYKPDIAIELGTCLGISTRYMIQDFEGTYFYSVEGSPERYNIAALHLNTLNKPFLTLLQKSFEEALPFILSKHNTIDFVFIDGNHTFEATKAYFEILLPYIHAKTILVFDDIHWSKSMLNAWKYIHEHSNVTLTVDIFQFGICFFNPDLSKENRVLRY